MEKKFVGSPDEPVVRTKAGKLRGFEFDGTYIFRGIPYAQAERFQMPTEVKPWEGVKDALSYGPICPLLSHEVPGDDVLVPHRFWPEDENCLSLNIWSRTLAPEAKKPVMVWIHGGGYTTGSSIEQVAYDGENMSRNGDVVVVSVNHRLNILGYMDLSPFGKKYRNSANAGNADLVAALRWIHDNIAGFGGDPGNVTLFGQSGGGMKVWNLLQTPGADGLFHKAVVQSGCIYGFLDTPKEDGTRIVNAMLKELGFDEGDAEKLETVPYERMAAAYNKVAPALAEQGGYVGCHPVPNEEYVGDPCIVGFIGHAKTIPVMVGTVFGEFGPVVPNKYELTEKEIDAMLAKRYGEASGKLTELFKHAYPEKSLADLIALDSLFRAPSKEFIEKRASCPESPVYSYLFANEFPIDGGRAAWHCAEIPFVFHNAEKVPVCSIPGVSERLQEQVFEAWIHFARYGSPSHPGLPEWPACRPDDEATMIFDRNCELRHNFDNELIALHAKASPKFPL